MRAREALGCTKKAAQVQQTIDGPSDRVRGQVAVEDGAVDSKKARKVRTCRDVSIRRG